MGDGARTVHASSTTGSRWCCWPAVQTPRMYAICQRLAGTQRHELLDCLILGEQHLHADSLPPQGQDNNNDDHDDNDRPDTDIHG